MEVQLEDSNTRGIVESRLEIKFLAHYMHLLLISLQILTTFLLPSPR